MFKKTKVRQILELLQQQKIRNLQVLLDQADNLRDEILAWYIAELKSYDYRADAEQELFDRGTGTTVEGISELAIMEALFELQIFNEVRKKYEVKFILSSFVQKEDMLGK